MLTRYLNKPVCSITRFVWFILYQILALTNQEPAIVKTRKSTVFNKIVLNVLSFDWNKLPVELARYTVPLDLDTVESPEWTLSTKSLRAIMLGSTKEIKAIIKRRARNCTTVCSSTRKHFYYKAQFHTQD